MNELFDLIIGQTIPTDISDFYLTKARNAIKYYLNYSDEEVEILTNQIVDLGIFFYRNKSQVGISQSSQGSRSQSKTEGIPNEIKQTLPQSKIKVV